MMTENKAQHILMRKVCSFVMVVVSRVLSTANKTKQKKDLCLNLVSINQPLSTVGFSSVDDHTRSLTAAGVRRND